MAHDISSLNLSAMSIVRSAACVAFRSVYALEAVSLQLLLFEAIVPQITSETSCYMPAMPELMVLVLALAGPNANQNISSCMYMNTMNTATFF